MEWAAHVGYRRVWLRSEIAEISPAPEQIGVAEVRCPTCASSWREESPEFWMAVRHSKLFPFVCSICGSEMPQWDVLEPPDDETHSARTAASVDSPR